MIAYGLVAPWTSRWASETRGYKPDQLDGNTDFLHTQKLFLGVTLNGQGLFDYLIGTARSRPARSRAASSRYSTCRTRPCR
jgi:hypothetical protein